MRSFERAMGILGGTRSQRRSQHPTGRWIMVPSDVTAPRRRQRIIQRRRRTFERLLALAALTFVIGFVPALRWMWYINLAADATVGLYIWRLLRLKQTEEPSRPEPMVEPVGGYQPVYEDRPRLVSTG